MIRLQNLAAQGAGHLALCLLLVFFAASLLAGCLPEQTNRTSLDSASCAAEEASEEFFAMDTKMTVKVYGEGAPEAAREAKERLLALDALWSATREGSDIARLNGGAGETVARLMDDGPVVFVEVSPHPMLCEALEGIIGDRVGEAVPSLHRGEGDAAGRGDTDLHHVANLGQATAMVTASALGSSPIRWQRDTFT